MSHNKRRSSLKFYLENMDDAQNEIGTPQPTHDIPDSSPEGPLKVLTSGTYRGSSGDSQRTNTKIDNLTKKCFLEVIALILHIYSCLLQEKNIQKF